MDDAIFRVVGCVVIVGLEPPPYCEDAGQADEGCSEGGCHLRKDRCLDQKHPYRSIMVFSSALNER